MITERPSRDEICMQIAEVAARRGTCTRAQVGAVIALDGRILVSGYNGPPAGLPHCTDGCGDAVLPGGSTGCTRAVHAEANCIAFAARHGVATDGADIYCTHLPCLKCAELLINAGIRKVFYRLDYRIRDGEALLQQAGIDIVQL